MAYNQSTEVQVLVYPFGNLPTPLGHRFALHENIGGILARAAGDSVKAATATEVPASWNGQTGFSHIDSTLDIVRFYSDDRAVKFGVEGLTGKEELVGFVCKRREAPFNCRMAAPLAGDPDSQNGFPDLLWKQTAPRITSTAPSRFRTKIPSDSPFRTRIQYHEAGKTLAIAAETKSTLARNQMLRWDIGWLQGVEGETRANARLAWGGRWSIARRQNVEPTLDLWSNNEWKIQARLGQWMPYSGDESWLIERLFGRLVLTCFRSDSAQSWWFVEKDSSGKDVTISWPQAPLRWSLYGVAATLGVTTLTLTEENGAARRGSFSRKRRHTLRYQGDPAPLEGQTKGWKTRATEQKMTVTELGNRFALYEVAMTASPDGIDTPGVSSVMAQASREWETLEEQAIDIRPACLKVTGKSADPAIAGTASAEWTIGADRYLLEKLIGADWETKVKKYVPIQIKIRRRKNDGSTTPWEGVFSGYIRNPKKANPAFNDWRLSLQCWDEMIRLTAPAGILDPENHLPLDFLAGGENNVYGGDCIQEIARIELGEEWADSINGNGDPRAFTPNAPPIFEWLLYEEESPDANKFLLPVPYFQDTLSWMKQIAEKTRCVLFFGKVPEYPTAWPVLIYGRYGNIVAGRTPKPFYDAKYVNGDLNALILDASTESIPEKDVNQVIVIGTQEKGEGLGPAVIAKSRLPAGDANNADNSWLRSLVVKSKWIDLSAGLQPAIVQGIASRIMDESRDFNFDAPSFTGRGDETIQWGDLITLSMAAPGSDPSLGLNGRTYRVLTWQHTINLASENSEDFTTELTLASLSPSGF